MNSEQEVTCEMQLGDAAAHRDSRHSMKDPERCGKPAAEYKLKGGIASVRAKLCDLHVQVYVQRGYTVEVIREQH